MGEWIVDTKGAAGDRSWEISVLHESNDHGKRSYGWFGPSKIFIGSSGGPCHDVVAPPVWTRLVAVAHEIAAGLNAVQNEAPVDAGMRLSGDQTTGILDSLDTLGALPHEPHGR